MHVYVYVRYRELYVPVRRARVDRYRTSTRTRTPAGAARSYLPCILSCCTCLVHVHVPYAYAYARRARPLQVKRARAHMHTHTRARARTRTRTCTGTGRFIYGCAPRVPQIRSYHVEYTASHQNCEVKRRWAYLVLRWGTTWERYGAVSFCFVVLFVLLAMVFTHCQRCLPTYDDDDVLGVRVRVRDAGAVGDFFILYV